MGYQDVNLVPLLAAVSRGDQQAFRHLYDNSADRLMGVCVRVLRDRSLAEEAVQEAFIRIWHNAGEYHEGRGTALAWMLTIARYQSIDLLRRRPAQTVDLGELEDSLEGAVTAEGLDHSALDTCLDQLNSQQRSSILLSFYYGLTHEELARNLDSPLGTVKSWLRRGLGFLKRCLSE